jgi:SEC-C motif-containing protein
MRSRYSAFAMARADYLLATRTETSGAEDRSRVEQWAKSVAWLGLQIVDATPNEVEFVAKYLERDRVVSLRERSRFERRDGRWTYASGAPTETSVRVGRNDLCPCGSGKKLKACHAGR